MHSPSMAPPSTSQTADLGGPENSLYRCSVCEKDFKTPSKLEKHFMIHTGEKPYECSACSRRFRHAWHLTSHFRIHTGEKPFQCGVCGRYFRQRSTRNSHLRNVCERVATSGRRNKQDGEMECKCVVCGERYPTSGQLKVHLQTHACRLRDPLVCVFCSKRFARRIDLRRHVAVHTSWNQRHAKQTPAQCAVCGKEFSHRSYLLVHLHSHSDNSIR